MGAVTGERVTGRAGSRLTVTGAGARAERGKGELVPSYYLVPWLLVVMSVGALALIYWGGFIEERRNGRLRS